MKTFDDLMAKVLEIFPNAIVSEDSNGEVVVSTGYQVHKSGHLMPMEGD